MIFWIAVALLALAVVVGLALSIRRAGGATSIATVLALAVPGLALAIYATIGAPGLPDRPYAERRDAAGRIEMQTLLGELEQRLEANPDRIDGWLLLARTRMKMGDYRNAATAFARARALAPEDGAIALDHGEALIFAENGTVTDAARDAMTFALSKESRNAKAMFYLGHDAQARGRFAEAIQYWTNVIAVSPPDATWLTDLRARIAAAAQAGNVDPSTINPTLEPAAPEPPTAAAPGPSADDVAAAQQMSPEDRQAFIRSMVERLAARLEDEPDDIDGWRRLARAWRVLGETQKAEEAEAKIKALETR